MIAVCIALVCLGILYYKKLGKEHIFETKKQKILTGILFCIAIVARIYFLKSESDDYETYLLAWVNELKAGGFKALGNNIGNYNVTYLYILLAISYINIKPLYLIKFVSIVFDFVLAHVSYLMIRELTSSKTKAYITYFIVLFLPTVVINSAWWAQCDSIYVSFVVYSLYYMFTNRPKRSIIALGIAFSFKLQTVFIMPLYLVFIMARRMKIMDALYFPIPYFLTAIPALIAGKDLKDIFLSYNTQVSGNFEYNTLNYNSPSITVLLKGTDDMEKVKKTAMYLIMATVIMLVVYYIISWINISKFYDNKSNDVLLMLAVMISLSVPFVLPYMHDRYFYIAEILSIYLAVVAPRLWRIPLILLTASFACYLKYMYRRYIYELKFLEIMCVIVLIFIQIRMFLVYIHNLKNNGEHLDIPKV